MTRLPWSSSPQNVQSQSTAGKGRDTTASLLLRGLTGPLQQPGTSAPLAMTLTIGAGKTGETMAGERGAQCTTERMLGTGR